MEGLLRRKSRQLEACGSSPYLSPSGCKQCLGIRQLADILYFSRKEGNAESFKVGRTGDHNVELSSHRALDGLQQIVKHES